MESDAAVSRETSALTEPVPLAADALFGDRRESAERFVQHLASTGVEQGLLGPREVGRIWTRHVLNCAAVSELLPPGAGVVDVGSGAGLPGIVLAIARPDLRLSLVEPMERRCRWLREVADDLGVAATVYRARAEEVVGTVSGDVVTARAVAPLDRLAGWCLPLLREHGELLALKGRTAAAEVQRTRAALVALGAGPVEIVTCGTGVLAEPTTVVRVRVGRPPAPRRRPGRRPR